MKPSASILAFPTHDRAVNPRRIAHDAIASAIFAPTSRVRAGFPSPADDYVEDVIDFNRHLIRQGHEDATYVLRVEGHSMTGAGIFDGDEVIVDRALKPCEGSVVIAVVNGDFTIKRLIFRAGLPVLQAENPHFADREFKDGEELVIWGVVTRVLHKV